MTSEQPKFSFVIPLLNEMEIFEELTNRLNNLSKNISDSCEVVLVDDGSTDITPKLMEEIAYSDERYHCIFLSRNFEHQFALSAGLKFS